MEHQNTAKQSKITVVANEATLDVAPWLTGCRCANRSPDMGGSS